MINPTKAAKLQWQCRRGMLELDLILNQFMKTSLHQLSDAQVAVLEKLLTTPDPQLYAWLMGEEFPKDVELANLVQFIALQY